MWQAKGARLAYGRLLLAACLFSLDAASRNDKRQLSISVNIIVTFSSNKPNKFYHRN